MTMPYIRASGISCGGIIYVFDPNMTLGILCLELWAMINPAFKCSYRRHDHPPIWVNPTFDRVTYVVTGKKDADKIQVLPLNVSKIPFCIFLMVPSASIINVLFTSNKGEMTSRRWFLD